MTSPRLAGITLPTLVIWGKRPVVPLDIGLRRSRSCPGADLHVLGRCGHVPWSPHLHLLTRFLA